MLPLKPGKHGDVIIAHTIPKISSSTAKPFYTEIRISPSDLETAARYHYEHKDFATNIKTLHRRNLLLSNVIVVMNLAQNLDPMKLLNANLGKP